MGNLPCKYLWWISVGGTWLGGIWPRYQTRHLLLHFFSSSQILSNSCLQMEQQLWELSPQTSSSQATCESCNEPDGSIFLTCTILASRGRGVSLHSTLERPCCPWRSTFLLCIRYIFLSLTCASFIVLFLEYNRLWFRNVGIGFFSTDVLAHKRSYFSTGRINTRVVPISSTLCSEWVGFKDDMHRWWMN